MKLFHANMKVNTCTVCEIGLFTEEEEGEHVGEIEVLVLLSCLETLVGHVILLKGLIAAAFKSSEPLHLLRLNGRVGAIPTERVYRLSNMYYSVPY